MSRDCWHLDRALTAALLSCVVAGWAAAAEWSTSDVAEPAYTADGRLKFPGNYREWIFLSSGLDMSYRDKADAAEHSRFDNVFAEPGAYREFVRTGTWPDGAALVLESRGAAGKGSINRRGRFQTGEPQGVEVHVKDTKRFPGGWAFFSFRGPEPAEPVEFQADCYSCHRQHAAVDTTFVQFYPTLLSIATLKGTLSPGFRP
ncbi:MAG TPA: cytochrome P460 family protein [Steroidobacteraceae bacterium]|nr:cytochrome P460 family protein [Steroidobacteraceae bacterium]